MRQQHQAQADARPSWRDWLQERFYRWALRGKAPEAAPITLTHKRVYVLPSAQGLAFAGMLIVMLIATMNYALSLGYVLVFLLAALGVITIIHTFRNLVQLRLQPGRCPAVFAGEDAQFGLLLENQRDTPRPALQLQLPGQTPRSIDVPANGQAEIRLSLPTTRRGWMTLPRVTLSTRYPLGLLRTWAYAAPDMRCLVYPAPARQAPPVPATPDMAGASSITVSPVQDNLDDFAGLRAHQASDPPRHIAWKAAARQHEAPLQTKLFSSNATEELWFDWQTLPAALDVEQRLAILSRWVCDADNSKLRWGLRLPGRQLEPGTGEAHVHACLKALALYGTHDTPQA